MGRTWPPRCGIAISNKIKVGVQEGKFLYLIANLLIGYEKVTYIALYLHGWIIKLLAPWVPLKFKSYDVVYKQSIEACIFLKDKKKGT
jgi:hypothetical protein